MFNYDSVAVYIHDMLVWGKSKDEHDARLCKVLQTARENGIILNKGKRKIAQNQVKYMGHIISERGVHVDEKKLKPY